MEENTDTEWVLKILFDDGSSIYCSKLIFVSDLIPLILAADLSIPSDFLGSAKVGNYSSISYLSEKEEKSFRFISSRTNLKTDLYYSSETSQLIVSSYTLEKCLSIKLTPLEIKLEYRSNKDEEHDGEKKKIDLCPVDDFRIIPTGYSFLLRNKDTFEIEGLPCMHLISPLVLDECDNPLKILKEKAEKFLLNLLM